MSQIVLSRRRVREVDRRAIEEFGMSPLVLMENAGRGCVEVLRSLDVQGPVAIVCGKGNNGGDGLVIARHLDNLGIATRVLLLCAAAELSGDALVNYRILKTTDVEMFQINGGKLDALVSQTIDGVDWIIDAMLGTGASGNPRPPFDDAIRQLNAAPARRLATDVPSGLDCDTGEAADPTFRAERTCTFVASKPGLLAKEAEPFVGIIHVVDIGVPRRLIEQCSAE